MASLDRNERAKLAKRASQLRKLAPTRKPARSHGNLMEDEDSPIAVKKTKSLEDYIWQIVSAESPAPESCGPTERLLVVGVLKNGFEVMRDGQKLVARPRSQTLEPIAVGDEALVECIGQDLFVTGFAPRRSSLSRPDVDKSNRQRVIAANLDSVVVVVSVISPPLHPRLIDRYLLAIQYGGCQPVLVVNKLDLAGEELRRTELAKLDPYLCLDLPIFPCVAHTGEGISELRAYLAGQTAAFVGHSGVGKSSLINAFDERLQQDVGSVSEVYGRGTHTTTRSSLIDLGDMRVIDTPGIRSFGLWDIKADELKLYFPEFLAADRCRFSDCTHVHEPGCGVKRAVETGQIPEARYETYLRIMESL